MALLYDALPLRQNEPQTPRKWPIIVFTPDQKQNMRSNWHDIEYLASGTETQQRAHRALTQLHILTVLAPYDATLVSTVCNDIDIPGSDLDIICHTSDHAHFIREVTRFFGRMPGFNVTKHNTKPPAVVIQFFTDGFEFEIFAQDIPIPGQNAFRHMTQTNRVLTIGGPPWRSAIRTLKLQGMKTEPAVAKLLGLVGDPYSAVLALENVSDEELAGRIRATRAPLTLAVAAFPPY